MQAALKALLDFETAQNSIPVLERTGLIQSRYLVDSGFQSYLEMLRRIDMGREPEFIRLGLEHWSRRWEYPFTIHGVLRYLVTHKMQHAKMLDAACGFSPVPFTLAALGHEVIGLDLDEACPKKWDHYRLPDASSQGSATFQFGNMEETKFPDNHFDIVYCVSSLEHTKNPEKGLAEFLRVTKPGGLILITCDSEPGGSTGIESARLEKMLAVMDVQGQLLYPPRFCHPSETLTFLTRSDLRTQSPLLKLARSTKEVLRHTKSANMAILGIGWIKKEA